MANYTIRTTSPAGSYLPYYMKTGTYTGAINDAILGNGQIAGANVLNNCVGYSVGRLMEQHYQINGTVSTQYNIFAGYNAEDWFTVAANAGMSTGQYPRAGAVGVYYNGSTGHVCNVERYYNNRWEISESHYYYDGGSNTNGSWDYSYLQDNFIPAFIGSDPAWYLIGFIYPFDGIIPIEGKYYCIKKHRKNKRNKKIIVRL